MDKSILVKLNNVLGDDGLENKNISKLRRKSREIALQLLYQLDIRSELDVEMAISLYESTEYWLEDEENVFLNDKNSNNDISGKLFSTESEEAEEVFAYAFSLVRGIYNNIDEVFSLLRNNIIGWRLERMVTVDKVAIILALYEGLISKSVPIAVAISEAVELSKIYGTSNSGRFVNGVLGRIVRKEKTE